MKRAILVLIPCLVLQGCQLWPTAAGQQSAPSATPTPAAQEPGDYPHAPITEAPPPGVSASDFQQRCEQAGGDYIPPSANYGKSHGGRTDVTGPQCHYPVGVRPPARITNSNQESPNNVGN